MYRFSALPTATVRQWQNGRPDAYGNAPTRALSDSQGNPCRHCLKDIPAGAEMLILAHRPFDGLHAYAETGPIFLCADPCPQGGGAEQPEILTTSPDYLVKGYSADERIVYGTGEVVATGRIQAKVAAVFADPHVAFIHIHSARNNCYQARVDRS